MEQKSISLRLLLIVAAAVLALELLSAAAGLSARLPSLAVIGLARLLQTVAMVIIISIWAGGLAPVRLAADRVRHGITRGLLWSAAFGACALLVFGILHLLGFNTAAIFHRAPGRTAAATLSLLLVGGLVSPVAEEIFFRGLVFGYLRRWGPAAAVLGSTALFSLAHLPATGVTFMQVVGGLLFAVAFEVEKNLLVPITIHVLGNTAIFTLSSLAAP